MVIIMGEPAAALIRSGVRRVMKVIKIMPLPYSYILEYTGDAAPIVPDLEPEKARALMPLDNYFLIFAGSRTTWAEDFDKAENFTEGGWVV